MYANGSVAVRPLPEEVHGSAAERTVPLRRLEGGPVQHQELDDYLAKELLKVRDLPCLQPPSLGQAGRKRHHNGLQITEKDAMHMLKRSCYGAAIPAS